MSKGPQALWIGFDPHCRADVLTEALDLQDEGSPLYLQVQTKFGLADASLELDSVCKGLEHALS